MRPRSRYAKTKLMGTLCATISAVTLLGTTLALCIIFLAAGMISTNKTQTNELQEIRDALKLWKTGCEIDQAELTDRIEILEEGNPGTDICLNGLCTRFPSNTHTMNMYGCWDAGANSPVLANSTGSQNDAYIVCTNGTTLLDGANDWVFGDMVIFRDGMWRKNDGTPEPFGTADTDPEHVTIPLNFTCGGDWIVEPVTVNIEKFVFDSRGVQTYVPRVFGDSIFAFCLILSDPISLEFRPESDILMRPHVTLPYNVFPLPQIGSIELLDTGEFRMYEGLNQDKFGAFGETFASYGSFGYEMVYLL